MQYNEYPISITCTKAPTNVARMTRSNVDDESTLAGWISPQGRYYRVNCYAGHSYLARCLTNDEQGGKRLENAGWAHLGMRGSVSVVEPHRLTRAQMDTLMTIAMLCLDTPFSTKIMEAINAP
jgi:hypothetical protein